MNDEISLYVNPILFEIKKTIINDDFVERIVKFLKSRKFDNILTSYDKVIRSEEMNELLKDISPKNTVLLVFQNIMDYVDLTNLFVYVFIHELERKNKQLLEKSDFFKSFKMNNINEFINFIRLVVFLKAILKRSKKLYNGLITVLKEKDLEYVEKIVNAIEKINVSSQFSEDIVCRIINLSFNLAEKGFIPFFSFIIEGFRNNNQESYPKNSFFHAFRWLFNELTTYADLFEDKDTLILISEAFEKKDLNVLYELKLVPRNITFSTIEEISNTLIPGIWNNYKDILENTRISVILIDLKGIQKFITRSEYRFYLAGASSYIETTLREINEELINKGIPPECIIFSTGGGILLVVPENKATDAYSIISNNVKRRFGTAVGIRTNYSNFKNKYLFHPIELIYGPIYSWQSQNNLPMRGFGGIFNYILKNLEDKTLNERFAVHNLTYNDICAVCFNKKGENRNNPEDAQIIEKVAGPEFKGKKICDICFNVIKHEYDKKYTLREKGYSGLISITVKGNKVIASVSDYIKEKTKIPLFEVLHKITEIINSNEKLNKKIYIALSDIESNKISFKYVRTWDELGKLSYMLSKIEEVTHPEIALIKGDGDNFGTVKALMSSIATYKQISRLFSEISIEGVAYGFANVILMSLNEYAENYFKYIDTIYLPFDVLYIGGDDLTLLLDAGFVFSFIKYLHEFLIQRVGLQKTGDYHKDRDNISALSPINLGYSLGISIFPNNMPLYMALYTTNELESMAKKKSKKRNIKHGGTITVAFQRFIGIPSKHIIHDIYGPKNGNIKLTAWPRSYDELFDRRKGILPKIKQLLAHDISANKILRFIKVDDIDADEIKLKINYAAARMSKSRQDEASLLRELARFSFIILDDILSFQLRDIVDIMRTVHENERLLAVS
ncbi:MAG: hypothetical protein ABGF52_06380 [Candidatus Asgardarchaeum sp.]